MNQTEHRFIRRYAEVGGAVTGPTPTHQTPGFNNTKINDRDLLGEVLATPSHFGDRPTCPPTGQKAAPTWPSLFNLDDAAGVTNEAHTITDSDTDDRTDITEARRDRMDIEKAEVADKKKGVDVHNKYELRSKPKKSSIQMPLRDLGGGWHYEPMGVRDMQALVDRLPNLNRGAQGWISDFIALMAGQRVAVSDFRAALRGCCSFHDAKKIEEAAQLTAVGDEEPFRPIASAAFSALRELFPQGETGSPVLLSEYTEKIDPTDFYTECVERWTSTTGRHPSNTPDATQLFRASLIRALPEEVRNELEKDPDLLDDDDARFRRHVVHALKLYVKHLREKKANNSEMEQQLLKLNLNRAREEAKRAKQKKKGKDNLMVLTGQSRGAGRGRGWGGVGQTRVGMRRGRSGCFRCGATDHLVVNCPYPPLGMMHPGHILNVQGPQGALPSQAQRQQDPPQLSLSTRNTLPPWQYKSWMGSVQQCPAQPAVYPLGKGHGQ
ncbi:uncharacterized protein LOC133153180 isoform X2 [Syngnathus typhle]|nr:uncharacterized protein LOC133153180 isoform X2 [Syngnathus typhle]XP_061133264.1 uncharacterized protein LOC133153180 isoform X2 [Syngnathus typhle]XP_061133265.1 uncharacterized protein LOC133153180 isoform X2 [Syngnathus typhle]